MRSLVRIQLRLGDRRAADLRGAARRAAAAASSLEPGLADVDVAASRCPGCCSVSSSTRCWSPAAWFYVRAGRAQRARLRRAGRVASERACVRRRRPSVAGHRRHGADRRLRAAALAHHQRLLRRVARRSRRCGTRRRSAGSTCRRRRSSAIAGLILAYGADMLWFPVGYTAGYLVLLVLVAAPLRRSGAYTLPDFAEARLESRRGPADRQRAGGHHRLALPAAAVRGRRAHGARSATGAPRLGGRPAGRGRRRVQRRHRRHAQHHLRAGLPVLAQADRPRRAGASSWCWPGGPTGHRRRATGRRCSRAHRRCTVSDTTCGSSCATRSGRGARSTGTVDGRGVRREGAARSRRDALAVARGHPADLSRAARPSRTPQASEPSDGTTGRAAVRRRAAATTRSTRPTR